jgi:hypothetical protein
MDGDKSGEVSFKEFTRWCDKRGMDILYKGQSADCMIEIDANGDGNITLEELKTYLNHTPKQESEPVKKTQKTFMRHLPRSELLCDEEPKGERQIAISQTRRHRHPVSNSEWLLVSGC